MQQSTRSQGTKIILLCIKGLFLIGVALVAVLVLCFVADMIGVRRDFVAAIFPQITVFIVYTALAMVLLRLVLAWSLRRDRR